MDNAKKVNSRAKAAASPLIVFPGGLRLARLVRRHKRFLVDVRDGSDIFTAHTNNTGSMLGLARPDTPVLLSVSDNPARRLAHTLEMARLDAFGGGFWVGVNTLVPNRLLGAAFAAGRLPEISGDPADAAYDRIRPEPAFARGRLDARLTGPAGTLLVETKNVTLVEDEVALFPDAPTERGRKHLEELVRVAREGRGNGVRAACVFVVQRPDGRCFGPADVIDSDYAALFWRAVDAGVLMWPVRADVGPDGIWLGARLPLVRRPDGLRSG
ncbi:DNA/RNA nuclease SfsA [Desulfolutivibrio sulfoxidireducens]|uniref:DNA/RNA nuclease SfsA n=1 Tax=Desulfolutivibrio sulfoxidireducens TaxID=2773299 RepID=UPI00210B0CCA|nr:DNA/RNA nuclease SfsA [Desulfolutivibrio sulfoxidireducens]